MIMIAQKLTPLWETIVRLRWLLLIIGCLYLGSLAGGVVVGRFAPPAVQSLFAVDESQRIESVEKIFGRFRAPVREGRVTTIVVCSGNAVCPAGSFARGEAAFRWRPTEPCGVNNANSTPQRIPPKK